MDTVHLATVSNGQWLCVESSTLAREFRSVGQLLSTSTMGFTIGNMVPHNNGARRLRTGPFTVETTGELTKSTSYQEYFYCCRSTYVHSVWLYYDECNVYSRVVSL